MRVTFGVFTFDDERRLLLRGAEPVHLGPKAFDLLHLLLERRPNVLSKAALMEHLWPNTFVAENNLATLINDLRTALEDDARDPRIIRTAHGVGYAFVANASEKNEDPFAGGGDLVLSNWQLVWGHTYLALSTGENIVGRPAQGVIGLDSPTVSRHHARLVISGEQATIEDLGSKNGTWIGSTRATGKVPVKHGDEIRFGLALVKLLRNLSDASTRTAEITLADDSEKNSRNS